MKIADDYLKADDFYRQASEGATFLWQGDFQNAKQLLLAVQRRISKNAVKKNKAQNLEPKELFHRHRQMQAHRAQLISRLLVQIESDLTINLPRAPKVDQAIAEALEDIPKKPFTLSLRELLGFIGAHEWRKKGVFVPSLNANIHPYYGVFSPVRGEYLELVAQAPLPKTAQVAFDIGTGTGVIAALLAKRGITKIIATDTSPRALACARENVSRLGYSHQIEIIETDLFPTTKADLIVCNPPWLPARPTSALEYAIYDEGSQMLKSFLAHVRAHLNPLGEVWLILSDLAEHLGLRSADELNLWIEQAQLKVIERHTTTPKHSKTQDTDDPLHFARQKEITSLWRLCSSMP